VATVLSVIRLFVQLSSFSCPCFLLFYCVLLSFLRKSMNERVYFKYWNITGYCVLPLRLSPSVVECDVTMDVVRMI